ncbi:MAG: hypothetical protein AB7H86_21910 [Blastocatellales bacterium]
MIAVISLVLVVFIQQSQNPSPMVEHTRAHLRLKEEHPAGRREKLETGALFIPQKSAGKLKPGAEANLIFYFHCGGWIPEIASSRLNRTLALSIQLGAGSSAYARPFRDETLFPRLIAEAETRSGLKFSTVTLVGWSAGYGAIREILRVPQNYSRVDRVLLIDGLHAGYVDGKPGPLESKLESGDLEIFLDFARDAVAGRKHLLITHSEIFPGTFASTTETADWLIDRLGLKRKPVSQFGPMGTQKLSETRAGRFRVIGFAGNSAPDHVDQLHSLPDLLSLMK